VRREKKVDNSADNVIIVRIRELLRLYKKIQPVLIENKFNFDY
jgi:hypothetical protein